MGSEAGIAERFSSIMVKSIKPSALADSICGKSTSYLLVLLNLEAVRTTEEQPGKFWFTYINVIVRFFFIFRFVLSALQLLLWRPGNYLWW